jgi:RHS repeat-associated protein
MDRVAGLVNSGQTEVASFNYDGFGNLRSESGSTNAPTGTGGDFRFHGAWLESESGLYNMRAREYDPQMGRFTSRDSDSGSFRTPETLQPYNYANNNPLIYSDAAGKFTIIEISVVNSIQTGLQGFRAAAIYEARKKALNTISKLVEKQVIDSVKALLPVNDLLANFKNGIELGDLVRRTICNTLDVPDDMYFEVPITTDGKPLAAGFTCNEDVDPKKLLGLAKLGVPRPDMIIGSKPPKSTAGGYPKTWLIGEFKATTATIYADYIKPGYRSDQFWSIINYAAKHTYSHTALFVAGVKGRNPPSDAVLIGEIGKSALPKGTIPIVVRIVD